MAKPGLDGHDRGIKILARAFRDDGMEVIYLGLRQDMDNLLSYGVGQLFGPGTPVQETIDYINDWYKNNKEEVDE